MENCITVIGSGATAFAAAAYLTHKGHRVILCDTEERYRTRLSDIKETGGITTMGIMEMQKPAIPYIVTSDFKSAIEHACRILVCVSANRHQEIADLCSPYAGGGQTYIISPGNLGSMIFLNTFHKRGNRDITVAELVGNICPCRIVGKARVLIALPIVKKRIAAFPASGTQKAIQAFDGFFGFSPAKNIFEGALNSPNLVIHLAGTLLNTTVIEKMGHDFSLYSHGLTPSLLKCAEVVESERDQILQTMGYSVYTRTVSNMYRMMDYKNHGELDYFRTLKGPASLKDRYVSEDTACSMALLLSLAEEYGIRVPVCRALVTIANAVNGAEYYKDGRTLENMGVKGLSIIELNQYLENMGVSGS